MAKPRLTAPKLRGIKTISAMLDTTLEPILSAEKASGTPWRQHGFTKKEWTEMLAGRDYIKDLIRHHDR
jgi:hypothetical protein